jgi:hypothetical protein
MLSSNFNLDLICHMSYESYKYFKITLNKKTIIHSFFQKKSFMNVIALLWATFDQ